MKHRLSETFGNNQVTTEQREQLVRSVFKRVAKRYDLMNDLMSMGVHRIWKWRFIRQIRRLSGQLIIDLAGGTGDIALGLTEDGRQVLIIDPSVEMMQVAKSRLSNSANYIAGTAENIPLPDNCADVLTIAFGIRNVTDINRSLHEIQRVLKPGGYFYCLEFSTPRAWLRPFYDTWSRWIIPRLGAWIAGHPDAYRYLIESIREFPAQQEMAVMIGDSGFDKVDFHDLSFGIACIHYAQKPRSG